MRTILLFLAIVAFQHNSYSCSWGQISFCNTVQHFDSLQNITIVSGVVTSADNDGVDFEVKEVLGGVESRTTLRIWDGTDFDCNGLHSMAANDFLKVGDSLVIMLPMIDDIENPWDQIGDYRMPWPWGSSPFLYIRDGNVVGPIVGDYYQDHSIVELRYEYFVQEFLGSGICDLDLPNLVVTFFHDKDEDGRRDFDENYLPLGNISLPNLGQFDNIKHSGISLYVPEGLLTVTYEQGFSDWVSSTQNTFEVDIRDFTRQLKIGLVPTQDYSNIVYDITNRNFRCGETVPFGITVTNEGTVNSSGIFWLEMDERLDTYVFEEEPDYVDTATGLFGWDYEELGPYESVLIPFNITAPIIDDPNQLNEIYVLKITDDINSSRESQCFEVELRCAFDPNDKQAFPIRSDRLALIDAPLRYTIRFQNTGNDYAKDVVVTDTLDEGLDLSTFKLVSTSHLRQLSISSNGGYDKKFEFTNIFLPDSITDEPNSHGHITFTISPKADISPEYIIDNNASIYFDFNPAILTNTVSRIMVDSFPVNSLVEIGNLDVEYYPNPTSNLINFSQQVSKVTFFDLTGREVKSAVEVAQLDVSDLEEGTYLMVLSDGKNSSTKRIAVLR